MGFFSFFSKAWDGLKSLPSKAWDSVKNGASDVWLTVKHVAGSVTNLVKSGAKAIGKAAPIVYHKARMWQRHCTMTPKTLCINLSKY